MLLKQHFFFGAQQPSQESQQVGAGAQQAGSGQQVGAGAQQEGSGQQVGAQHAGSGQQVGSGQQQLFFFLKQPNKRLKKHFFLGAQHWSHELQQGSGAQQAGAGQQVGAGAQQAGAGAQQAGSGQQVGAGAQQDGAGAQQAGSGVQQQSFFFLQKSNSPASADPALQTIKAAVKLIHFIFELLLELFLIPDEHEKQNGNRILG